MREHIEGHERLLESWLEARRELEADPEARRSMFDPLTGLPTVPLLFPRMDALLSDRGEFSLLCFDVIPLDEHGGIEAMFDDAVKAVASALADLDGNCLRDADIVGELSVSGGTFVVVLSPPRQTLRVDPLALEKLAGRVETYVCGRLEAIVGPAVAAHFKCKAGVATLEECASGELERCVFDAVVDALEGRSDAETADAG